MFAALQARLAAAAAAAELGLPPEAAEEMLEHARESGIDFENFGNERASKQIISEHNKALRHMMQQMGSGMQYAFSTSSSWNVKPADEFAKPPPYAALSPISCQDLQLHTTHR